MSNYQDWIPHTVKTLRGKQTLQELSDKTGFSVSYLSDIERGRTVPSIGMLDIVITACGAELVLSVDCQNNSEYTLVSTALLRDLMQTVRLLLPEDENV